MELGQFIEQSNNASSIDEIVGLYQGALNQIGFDRMIYSAVKTHDPTNDVCMATSYPMEWLSYYVEQGYMTEDPLRRYGMLQRSTFFWDDLGKAHRFSAKEKKVMHEARDAHLYNGAAVPLFGPGGEVLGVSVASSSPQERSPSRLSLLTLLTVQFHTVYGNLAKCEEPNPVIPALSRREREVLQWAAQGKSNWVIGELLNISEHGVDYHFRNILRKLDADSRITAVVKALYYGIISL